MARCGNEFKVKLPANLKGYAEKFPYGWIGQEVPPAGISGEGYVQSIEFRDSQRFIRFGRPFVPDLKTGIVATDADNGMWIPDRLLAPADIAQ